MQLSQYNLCTRKTELVLRDETNYLSRLSPSLREFIARARSAEQRGDVKYVSTAVLVNSVDLAHVFSWVLCDQSRGLFLCWPAESFLLPLNHLFSVVVVVVVFFFSGIFTSSYRCYYSQNNTAAVLFVSIRNRTVSASSWTLRHSIKFVQPGYPPGRTCTGPGRAISEWLSPSGS